VVATAFTYGWWYEHRRQAGGCGIRPDEVRCSPSGGRLGRRAVDTVAEAVAFCLRDVAEDSPLVAPPANIQRLGLTDRELEVLRLVAHGNSNREIAAALVLSIRTIERHIENLYAKIGANGRAEATAYALRQRLA
jgi:DNA-binding NarL/FixJ family response regulator